MLVRRFRSLLASTSSSRPNLVVHVVGPSSFPPKIGSTIRSDKTISAPGVPGPVSLPVEHIPGSQSPAWACSVGTTPHFPLCQSRTARGRFLSNESLGPWTVWPSHFGSAKGQSRTRASTENGPSVTLAYHVPGGRSVTDDVDRQWGSRPRRDGVYHVPTRNACPFQKAHRGVDARGFGRDRSNDE